ncbi:hypothetical protein AC1031_005702 [Aphanomyces cochlioides]|nr:hypothetical protein AC1031_005702 [Aphanomyces cochlioides]
MIQLPIGMIDRVQRAKAIAKSTNETKTSLEKDLTLFTKRVSVAISTVRGPPVKFSLGDDNIEMFRGFMCPPPGVNVGIGITSFANELYFSVATDKSIDANKLMAAIEADFRALQAATMVKPM